MGRVKRIWYLSPMGAAKVQASLRIRAVSPEPPLLAHTSNESRGTFRQKARSLAPLNGRACAVKFFHDGMLEDTNSLDAAHFVLLCFSLLFLKSFTYSLVCFSFTCFVFSLIRLTEYFILFFIYFYLFIYYFIYFFLFFIYLSLFIYLFIYLFIFIIYLFIFIIYLFFIYLFIYLFIYFW